MFRGDWYAKPSCYLEWNCDGVVHLRHHKARYVDLKLPAHPLPQAQQRYPLSSLGEKPVEGTQHVTHGTNRLIDWIQQVAQREMCRSTRQHV